jgi:hypothetical protein
VGDSGGGGEVEAAGGRAVGREGGREGGVA